MDIERPHKTTNTLTTTTSDLFICFKSHISHSNSSMRLSSKSNLNPSSNGVERSSSTTSSTSLTTSLSRRLRHNGSLRKGAQSPAMFPKNNKKSRGSSGFVENPEPSSPKVTCIGQVRVKTKKQGKKMKMLACRSKGNGGISGGETSFRRKRHGSFSEGIDKQSKDRNQRWVHLPLTICESLKGFGSEFSCLIPCKSSCFSGNNKRENVESGSSCGGVFRWMVSLQEGEGKKDIELVVSGDNEEIMEEGERERVMERVCSRRRSIFDDVEFDDLFNNGNNNVGSEINDDDDNDGVRRVSLCVPPKNALLLMRCRSDPMRMASLSQKFWDPPLVQQVDDGDNEVDEEIVVVKEEDYGKVDEKVEVRQEDIIEIMDESVKLEDLDGEIYEMCEDLDVVGTKIEALLVSSEEFEEKLEDEKLEIENRENTEEQQSIEEETEEKHKTEDSVKEEQVLQNVEETQLKEGVNLIDGCSIETITIEEKVEECEDVLDLVKVSENQEMEVIKGVEREESCDLSTNSSTSCTLSEESTAESKELEPKEENEEKVIVQGEARKSTEKEKNSPMLPDCLLLMMCEPKLSMEVSKETWVCSNDFIRWLPERHLNKKPNKIEGVDDQSSNSNSISNKKTKAAAVAALPPLAKGGRSGIQPGRSSISFPTGGGSVTNMIEQKLAKAGVGYEPCVLTRCKSAPLRSTAKFVAPELNCSMWGGDNGRKLEPHKPAICGVGSAGVGF